MPFRLARSTAARFLALAAAALLAACAPNQLVQQQANPEYAGQKRFKRVLVIAASNDDLVRRVFEDDVVKRLGERGIQGVPGYSLLPRAAAVDQATLKRLIAESRADAVLTSRVTAVDTATYKSRGYTAFIGVGWGGFYDYYTGIWDTVKVAGQTVSGPTTTLSETRLFDARTGTLAWSGVVETTDRGGTLGAGVQQYTGLVLDAMIRDGVL
jgi:hypothetical protein